MKIQVLCKRNIEEEKKIAKRFIDKRPDIIVQRENKVVTAKDGGFFYKTDYQAVNLTKKINETSKIVKQENAMSKLAELEEVLKNTKI